MPKYYGCPCEGCGKPLTLQDDIVVCPDCGAPYHRDCYEKLGRCIHSPAHAAGYEWKFPLEYKIPDFCLQYLRIEGFHHIIIHTYF